MPSWPQLLKDLEEKSPAAAVTWLKARQRRAMNSISALRGNTNVAVYSSGFLQKPQAPAFMLQITHEDINGFMSILHGMRWDRGLTLLLHTPGGVTNAAETIVNYLRSKFSYIEVIVPVYAMSAGTMISLAGDKIVMGRQSQLGPIDPQLLFGTRAVSARAIVDQFERAKVELLQNGGHISLWAPILQQIGPALLQESQNALEYGERMVAGWLASYMLKSAQNPAHTAQAVARFFNDAGQHKSHGRRIDRDEARRNGVSQIEDLEANQALQEQVLTLHHLVTLTFERSLACKIIMNGNGVMWVKNQPQPAPNG